MKYFSILIVLVVSLVVRVYHTQTIMGFWYDQGRDALVIAKLVTDHKWFLIGPTTGIEGIFLGPFYYYFITPFYWLGQGNPVFPAVWLATTNVLAVLVMYWIGVRYSSQKTGLLAAILYGVSYKIAFDSRWLSNPTALPLFSVISIWMVLKVMGNTAKARDAIILGAAVGISLQLEAASAIFFLPIVFIVLFKKRQLRIFGLGAFLLTLIPQMIFNIRHENILFLGFQNFLITKKSFQALLVPNMLERLMYDYQMFSHRLFPPGNIKHIALIAVVIFSLLTVKKLKNNTFLLLMLWWILPIVALLFYHGNNGYVWDYYFTGAYPAFFLSVAWILSRMPRVAMAIFVTIFLFQNIRLFSQLFSATQPTYITLDNVMSSVDWVYTDAGNRPFNVDIYVPPVQADAYKYVIEWRGKTVHKTLPSTQNAKVLYLIIEPDAEHPYYRQKWLMRQASYGVLEKQVSMTPLLIQRISRYDFK